MQLFKFTSAKLNHHQTAPLLKRYAMHPAASGIYTGTEIATEFSLLEKSFLSFNLMSGDHTRNLIPIFEKLDALNWQSVELKDVPPELHEQPDARTDVPPLAGSWETAHVEELFLPSLIEMCSTLPPKPSRKAPQTNRWNPLNLGVLPMTAIFVGILFGLKYFNN